MSSDGDGVTRRYMLQTLGATGAAAVAGCMGGGSDESESEETPTEEDNSTPVQTTEEPDYELPESEHVDTADFFKELMILPPGDEYAGASYSPSKLHENYDTTLMDAISDDSVYDKFEFSDEDIPETFVEEKPVEGSPTVKVDQLPNNVTEEDVVQQLKEDGYSKDREIGGFEVYTARGDKHPHAVGKDRHIVGWAYSVPLERANGMIDSVLEQEADEQLTLGEDIEGVIDALNVQDSLTLQKDDTILPIDQDYQPEIAASSVNFEEGSKYGAWAFEDEETADTAYAMLEGEDLGRGFESIDRNGRFITAQGNYDVGELAPNTVQVSTPRL